MVNRNPMGNVLTEEMGKVLDIYKSVSLAVLDGVDIVMSLKKIVMSF